MLKRREEGEEQRRGKEKRIREEREIKINGLR